MDQFGLEVVIDLATKPSNQNLQNVGKGIVVFVPDMCRDGGPIDNYVLVGGEEFEQGKLLGCELDRTSSANGPSGREIDLQVGHSNFSGH